jgi:hypothetical protein
VVKGERQIGVLGTRANKHKFNTIEAELRSGITKGIFGTRSKNPGNPQILKIMVQSGLLFLFELEAGASLSAI